MLTLYFAPGSSSMAAHIALHETGAAFEGRPMSFRRNDMQSPDFLKINPAGKVPTLLIDGRVLTEVAGILFYLARRFPQAELLPSDDIEAEAQAISWMSFIASTLHPARQKGIDHARTVYAIPTGGLAPDGRSASAIPSPTSICSGCIGACSIRSSPRLARFRTSMRITRE